MDSEGIQRVIPHRHPFLLVDRIVELEAGKRAVGIKCVTHTEHHFAGHFPGLPLMPGVLIVEALAQVGAVALLSLPENEGKVALFAGIKDFRFKRPVVPGDVLRLETELTRMRGPVGFGTATATVDGEVAAKGEMTFAVAEREELG